MVEIWVTEGKKKKTDREVLTWTEKNESTPTQRKRTEEDELWFGLKNAKKKLRKNPEDSLGYEKSK